MRARRVDKQYYNSGWFCPYRVRGLLGVLKYPDFKQAYELGWFQSETSTYVKGLYLLKCKQEVLNAS